MNRPAWLLGLGLVLGWMVLNDGYTPGHLLFAVLLATLLMRGVHRLRPTQPRVRRLGLFVPLIAPRFKQNCIGCSRFPQLQGAGFARHEGAAEHFDVLREHHLAINWRVQHHQLRFDAPNGADVHKFIQHGP